MNFPNAISATFNQPITLGVGTLKVYKDNVLFLTFTQADIVIVGSTFTIDVTNLFPDFGSYFIIISEGLFKGIGCNDFSIKNITDWTFEIVGGQYDPEDYDTTNDYT
jgi:hypothetical protein